MSKKSNVSRIPKIEKNIPVPFARFSNEFDFMEEMEIGDSFFLSIKQWDVKKAINNARNWAVRRDRKICIRQQDDGARVWRVA